MSLRSNIQTSSFVPSEVIPRQQNGIVTTSLVILVGKVSPSQGSSPIAFPPPTHLPDKQHFHHRRLEQLNGAVNLVALGTKPREANGPVPRAIPIGGIRRPRLHGATAVLPII